MDTRTAATGTAVIDGRAPIEDIVRAARIQYGLDTLKTHMPNVYALIKEKAERYGGQVYALVRRGLAGEQGCFYAFEAGHVLGQPLGVLEPIKNDTAGFLVHFGCAYVCIFGKLQEPAAAGA